MIKSVLKYGLISGLMISVFMLLSVNYMMENMDSSSMLLGFATMFVALTLIYFAIREYKMKHLGGKIKFLQALTVGLLVAFISSLMYASTWTILTYQKPEIVEQMWETQMEGATPEEIEQTESFMKIYETPIGRIGVTLLEMFPFGVLLSIIYALILTYFPKTKETEVNAQ
jgi:amino acid transporter